ncbi:MAG TPA: hypothetical protein ENK52_06630 [Saprospiraceae bacterium]|nr:hypothetical protein [Saprospiraceae bacterium]
MTSCVPDVSEERANFISPNGAYPYVTDVVNGFFDLADIDNASSGFTVNSSVSGDVSVSSIDVMKSFNGGAAVKHATLSGSTAVVSLNIDEATSGLGVIKDSLALGDEFTFSFVLNTSDGRALTSPVKVGIPMSCISDLAGMYEVTTTYGAHDFLADLPTNTTTAEIVKEGEGVYSVADFSGGLYAADGLYGVAYGTTGFPVTFRDVCNQISWTDQSDPWGAVIPLDGGVNSVDPATGVITISWFCEGYGENGVSVYTPQ